MKKSSNNRCKGWPYVYTRGMTETTKSVRRFERIVRMAELSARLDVEVLKVNVNDYESEHEVSITSKNGGDYFTVKLYDGLIVGCKHFPTHEEMTETYSRGLYEIGEPNDKPYRVSLTHVYNEIKEILWIWGREEEAVVV